MTPGVVCGSCGTRLRKHAKFCDECGAPTAASAESAEYKQVTVLFADVVRSMDLAAALELERYREIMTDLVERSAAEVRRYGGGTVKSTGDGVMAIFGAPIALEDHAFRGCLTALAIQEEADRLAGEVARNDGVDLRLRVGLNSGPVIAGEIGSGSLGYAATGETVGFAQRMESVAPPGGVMLSESTARLVEQSVMLGQPELVRIKGADQPVPARRLMGIGPRDRPVGRTESSLIGRHWEMAALEAIVNRMIGGDGAVVGVAGPPGVGKSRTARETAALAAGRGVKVFWAFCESHAGDVPFRTVAQLLRARTGVADLDDDAARARVREQFPDADPKDLMLLEDLIGINDPKVPPPQIDPDARRRRLTALINAATLGRSEPALFIIEDAQWIDAASESMLVNFLTVIPQTASLVLITYRPEYEGRLMRVDEAQTITLAPLDDSDTAALIGELLGSDPSVGELAAIIAERAAGNPFFAEEMVRELAQRGVLAGERGGYVCRANVNEVSVPATVQAAIEARIDRLHTPAKRTLYAASVIGAHFGAELLAALGIDPLLDELRHAELIDQVRFTPNAEYAFRHPLIRAVAYESQLKSDRAEWHRRLAAAIETRGTPDADAALIAEHLEAAGDLRAAYGWRMRAGAWSTTRDITAARFSWERARQLADALPTDDADRTTMRIAPRTMLCISAWRGISDLAAGYFDELRELCALTGDKASLAIAMSGLSTELMWHGHAREASRLASEQMALLESIGDPTLTIGAAYLAISVKINTGEITEALRWSQAVIDLAEGDPAKGANLAMGSPLAGALAFRSAARYWLGRPGWREDLNDAVAMARSSDPVTHALVAAVTYGFAIGLGVLRADDSVVREIGEALRAAEGFSGDTALGSVKLFLAGALTYRDTPADRQRGLELLEQVRDSWLRERSRLYLVPAADLYVAREWARRGDRDGAISAMRKAADDLFQQGLLMSCFVAQAFLVETLLERRASGDVADADSAIDRLATLPSEEAAVMRDIWLLRLHALLAQAHGDESAYRDYRDRYRDMAKTLGFEGHIAWAEAMP
jgi:class 3 adenylate cyclase